MRMTTFVTCFFNLPKIEKNEKRRSTDKYIKHSLPLLEMNINLVYFGDEEMAKFVFNKRKEFGLLEKTFIYTMEFESLPYYSRLEEIQTIESTNGIFGVKGGYHFTPHYMVCIWSKPYLLEKASKLNVFNSLYFYWIDFAYFKLKEEYSSSFSDVSIESFRHIETCAPTNDRLRLNMLGKPNFTLLKNKVEFFKSDRYYCAGGLFGGSIKSIETFQTLFNKEVNELLSLKISANEESIFAFIAYNNPTYFDITISMYATLLKNFCYISSEPLRVMEYVDIYRLADNHLFETQVCEKLLLGHKLRKITLTNIQLLKIYNSVLISSFYVDYKLYKKYCDEIILFHTINKIPITGLIEANLKF